MIQYTIAIVMHHHTVSMSALCYLSAAYGYIGRRRY